MLDAKATGTGGEKHLIQLEKRVAALRLSRRVLMNLLTTLDRQSKEQVAQLEAETISLRKRNETLLERVRCLNDLLIERAGSD